MSLELGRLLRRLKNITELLVVQDTFLPDLQYLSGLAQIGTAATRKWVGSNYHSCWHQVALVQKTVVVARYSSMTKNHWTEMSKNE